MGRGGGWVHPKGVNSMAASGLAMNMGLENSALTLHRADFSSRASYHWPSILITYSLMSGCG